VAPVEDETSVCPYCKVQLKWESVIPIDKDDFRFQKQITQIIKNDGEAEDICTFPMTQVNGGATEIITASPQLPFKPHRIFIPKVHAQYFCVNEFRIGRTWQIQVTSAPIPAVTFSEDDINPRLNCDTCMPGQVISLSVTNLTVMVATISAILKGKIIRSEDLPKPKGYGRFNL
jgi:hypothetical protein